MTGVKTLATHVVPTINAAGRRPVGPTPRVVCSLPISVTSASRHQGHSEQRLAIYGTLPSYRACWTAKEPTVPPTSVSSAPRAGLGKTARTRRGRVRSSRPRWPWGDDRDETYDTLFEFQATSASFAARQLGVLELVQVDTIVIMASSAGHETDRPRPGRRSVRSCSERMSRRHLTTNVGTPKASKRSNSL